VTFDPAGNVVGRLVGSEPGLPEIWSGSHLDTPPDGGRFDGALGTLLALDAAEAMRGDGPPRRTVAAMAFRLEEGPRFGRGVFGSRAVCGMLDDDEGDLVDPDGITLAEAFAALGYGELPEAGWLDPAPAAFVEAHIEQGPTLAAMGAPLGIVTSIAGMAGLELTFTGRRGHAGTVQMHLRSDALDAAARFVVDAHEAARSLPGAVATIGRLTISPGASNTIPERAELFADLRAPDDDRVEALVTGVTTAAHNAARAANCEVVIEPRWRYEAVAMTDPPRAALQRAVAALGVEPAQLPSGAGHDAAILALAGIPSAMLFVRSDAGGVSHAPEESTGLDAVVLAVQAVEGALRELAGA
jgi:hydantoinase/carbamoylase family amidase